MRVAICHYWLIEIAGGERVLESICSMYPSADLYVNVHRPERLHGPLAERRVHTTLIQQLPFSDRLLPAYVALMPAALGRLDLRQYDLVISNESAPAKGMRVGSHTTHVCYCLSPMRYVWDMEDAYVGAAHPLLRPSMRAAAWYLRQWDRRSSGRLDAVAAISEFTRARVRRYWRRDAEIIYPPVDVDRFAAAPSGRRERFLFFSRLVPYKRADLAVDACTRLGIPLDVAGSGPELARLQRRAGPTVRFLGALPDSTVPDTLANARALIFPAEEDFGIIPVEAMAAGTPVIAFGRGGALDTVVDGETGVFFHEQSVDALVDGLRRFEEIEPGLRTEHLRQHARRFARAEFERQFGEFVQRAIERRHP